jgi:hypothetical protein
MFIFSVQIPTRIRKEISGSKKQANTNQTNVLNPLLRKGNIPSITRETNPAPLG